MRAEHPHVHRNPLPTLVTIAKRPSGGGGMGGYNHDFPKNGSKLFSSRGLKRLIDLKDRVNLLFWRARDAAGPTTGNIALPSETDKLICPTGQRSRSAGRGSMERDDTKSFPGNSRSMNCTFVTQLASRE